MGDTLQSEDCFRIMADTTPALMWMAGADSLCILFNRTWLEFTGRSLPQELGHGWLDGVHPEDRQQVVDSYRAAFEARRAFKLEYRLHRVEGDYAWIADTGVPRFSEKGIFEGYIGSGFDITDRKLAEKRLRESEEDLKVLMDAMPVGVGWCDASGAVEYVNRSFTELFGYTRDEIPTLDAWYDKVYPDPDYRREIVAAWNAAVDESTLKGTAVEPVEADVTCRDGSQRHIILSTQFARSRRLVIFTDTTDRDLLQDRRLNAQRLESLGVLAGRMAHDFNNVLTGIMGNISLGRLYLDSPEKAGVLLEHAEFASRRAAELVNQLLTFAKGGVPIKRPLSLRQLVVASVDSALRGSEVQVVRELPEHLPGVEGDASQLNQAFHHIILNAVQAMAGRGVLTVSASETELAASNGFGLPAGQYLALSFADGGSGIPDVDLKRVFDPYFTTKPNSIGIGLTSVLSIVKKHGGDIDIRSKVESGTIVTLLLPSSHRAVSEEQARAGGASTRTMGSGAILVMDDEWIVRDTASEMLKRLGYQVTTCSTGAEAVAMYRAELEACTPFAAAIMDLTVPCGMGGKKAAQEILKIDPSACLIVSSGYSNDPVISDCAKYGFRAALIKPYLFEELQVVLSTIEVPPVSPSGESGENT